jgi:hypothetical protein
MGRQLGWVWFGGREYKIVVFYLTNDNSVFCREDANDPLLLVSQLPKRVQMGFSGSIGGDTVIPLGDEGIGGYDISDGFEINFTGQEFSIGNSLDDLREVVPPDRGQIFPEQLRYRRSTVDIFATSTSSQSTSITARLFGDAFFVARFNVSPPGSDNSGTRATAVFRYITGVNSGNLNYNQIRSTGSGSASWSIPSISNAYGFTARVLPGKTIFAVTDKIGFARFEAYRGRITTGTIDNFETYELPNVPTLDSDLFTENDGYSPTNKVPYSIINSFRFFNRYNADHSTTCFVDGINLFWFEGRDYMTSGSTVAIKIFDSAIHQNNSQAISQQIPGLPANTKAVLGVLACPV